MCSQIYKICETAADQQCFFKVSCVPGYTKYVKQLDSSPPWPPGFDSGFLGSTGVASGLLGPPKLDSGLRGFLDWILVSCGLLGWILAS